MEEESKLRGRKPGRKNQPVDLEEFHKKKKREKEWERICTCHSNFCPAKKLS